MAVALLGARIDARDVERHLDGRAIGITLVERDRAADGGDGPRTVVIIMCLAENSIVECAASIVHVIARSGAVVVGVIVGVSCRVVWVIACRARRPRPASALRPTGTGPSSLRTLPDWGEARGIPAAEDTMHAPDERKGRPARPRHDVVDATSEQSFPASDVPSWTPLHTGAPGKHQTGARRRRPSPTVLRRRPTTALRPEALRGASLAPHRRA
jgi:hypothetical protein